MRSNALLAIIAVLMFANLISSCAIWKECRKAQELSETMYLQMSGEGMIPIPPHARKEFQNRMWKEYQRIMQEN